MEITTKIQDVSENFGFNTPIEAPIVEKLPEELQVFVPEKETAYQFDFAITRAILAGFTHNKRVLIQGLHGTGKSSHIEQVAAQLGWPMVRINLDGHVSRIDLVGRDAILLKDGKQVTEFKEGMLPWAMQQGIALVLDEYDAGRPDVMFVLQRLLEAHGKLTLTEEKRIISPSATFRLFATANTIGLGDASGMYHGTNPINQGQMDRWNIVAQLDYLDEAHESAIIRARVPEFVSGAHKEALAPMIAMASLTRAGFKGGDISTVMSPRTVLAWAQNIEIFGDVEEAFRLSFLNRCDEAERPIIAEYYQRCFGTELKEASAANLAA